MTDRQCSTTNLNRESRIGAMGTEGTHAVAVIDLSDYPAPSPTIAEDVVHGRTTPGLFQLNRAWGGWGIPLRADRGAFALSEAFFAPIREAKEHCRCAPRTNAGWIQEPRSALDRSRTR